MTGMRCDGKELVPGTDGDQASPGLPQPPSPLFPMQYLLLLPYAPAMLLHAWGHV